MFDPSQASTGTSNTTTRASYTTTLALSAAALLLIPTWPIGGWLLGFAIAVSLPCLGLAWPDWTRLSTLSVTSLAARPMRAK